MKHDKKGGGRGAHTDVGFLMASQAEKAELRWESVLVPRVDGGLAPSSCPHVCGNLKLPFSELPFLHNLGRGLYSGKQPFLSSFFFFFFLSPHVHFPTEFSQYPFPVCLWGGHILLRYLFPILLGNCLGVLLPFTPTHTHTLICIAPFYCFLSSQDYLIPFYVQVTFFRGAF